MKHIVKRSGRSEEYDERKLYASVYAACLSVRESTATAELIAAEVCKHVRNWLTPKSEVSSRDIRSTAAKHLQTINQHAALIYTHHRIMW